MSNKHEGTEDETTDESDNENVENSSDEIDEEDRSSKDIITGQSDTEGESTDDDR